MTSSSAWCCPPRTPSPHHPPCTRWVMAFLKLRISKMSLLYLINSIITETIYWQIFMYILFMLLEACRGTWKPMEPHESRLPPYMFNGSSVLDKKCLSIILNIPSNPAIMSLCHYGLRWSWYLTGYYRVCQGFGPFRPLRPFCHYGLRYSYYKASPCVPSVHSAH